MDVETGASFQGDDSESKLPNDQAGMGSSASDDTEKEMPSNPPSEAEPRDSQNAGETDSYTGSSAKFTHFADSHVNYAAGDMYVYDFPEPTNETGKKVSPLKAFEVLRILKVYVPPPNYAEFVAELERSRFLILVGPPHKGKYATAIRAATDIAQKHYGISPDQLQEEPTDDSPVMIPRRLELESFMDFIQDEDYPDDTVLIVEDAFKDPGVSALEIDRHGPLIQHLLQQKNGYAIFTTDIQELREVDISDSYKFAAGDLTSSQLSEVLAKHLLYNSVVIDSKVLTVELQRKIISTLPHSCDIDRFAKALFRSNAFDATAIENVLLRTRNVGVDTQLWFDRLDINEQLYAMIASLHPELNRGKLWEIYDKAISGLRAKGATEVKNALDYPEGRLISKMYAHVTAFDSLEFDNSVHRDYALAQIDSSFRPQFQKLVPILASFMIEHKRETSLRIILASAIGELAKSCWEECQEVFYEWASNPEDVVRSSVGHALRQTSSNIGQRRRVLDLLETWSKSDDSRIRWTVAATAQRIFAIIPDRSIKLLQRLSTDTDASVRGAVSYALVTIAKLAPDAVISLLLTWTQSADENQRRTATNAFWRLLNRNQDIPRALQTDAKKEQILPLLKNSCMLGGIQLENALKLMREWVSSGESLMRQSVEATLLSAYEEATHVVRANMFQIVKDSWGAPSADPDFSRYVYALVGLMEAKDRENRNGVGMDNFITIVDSHMLSGAGALGHDQFRYIGGELCADVNQASLYVMGSTQPRVFASLYSISPSYNLDLPRLIGPILRVLRPGVPVLVFKSGVIIDLDDYRHTTWENHIFIVSTENQLTQAWPHLYAFSSHSPTGDLLMEFQRFVSSLQEVQPGEEPNG